MCVVWKGEEDREPGENLGEKQFFALVDSPHNLNHIGKQSCQDITSKNTIEVSKSRNHLMNF